jgi:hypothetical protein
MEGIPEAVRLRIDVEADVIIVTLPSYPAEFSGFVLVSS